MRGSAPIEIISLVSPSVWLSSLALSSIAAPGCSVYESIAISVETKEKDTRPDS